MGLQLVASNGIASTVGCAVEICSEYFSDVGRNERVENLVTVTYVDGLEDVFDSGASLFDVVLSSQDGYDSQSCL